MPTSTLSDGVLQMMRHFRQLRSTPLNSVETLRPIVFVFDVNPSPGSRLHKILTLTPAVYYAVGQFKRYHTIDNLPEVLSRASVILLLANGQEFARNDVSVSGAEEGMVDADTIRVAHDCEVRHIPCLNQGLYPSECAKGRSGFLMERFERLGALATLASHYPMLCCHLIEPMQHCSAVCYRPRSRTRKLWWS
jgi:hypothetical protein